MLLPNSKTGMTETSDRLNAATIRMFYDVTVHAISLMITRVLHVSVLCVAARTCAGL